MTDVTTFTYAFDETTLEYVVEVTSVDAAGLGPQGPPGTGGGGEVTEVEFLAHTSDTDSVHGIPDTTVLETQQGAQDKVNTHINDATQAHAATAVSFAPAGTIAATEVQAAIQEVATDAAADATTKANAAAAASDPAGSATAAASGAASALASHVAAADPHTGYQKESEKDVANGYLGLDGSALIPDAKLPSGITRDAEHIAYTDAAIVTEIAARNSAISAAIAAVVNGAPGAFDTLLEIYNQLQTDEGAVSALITTVSGKQASDGMLTALSGLTTAADQFPYFTGPDTIALGSISSFFRTLTGSADAPTLRGLVGLGNVDNTSDATKNAASVTLTNKTLTSPVVNTPTGIVKGDVGLGNVDNTSNATERAASATLTNKTLTSPVVNTPTGIVKGDVGLGNVDNTSNATERAASATLTNKTLTSPVINTPTGIVKGDVGLGNVDNASLTTHAALASGVHGITAAAATLLDDTTIAAMRNTLGIPTPRDYVESGCVWTADAAGSTRVASMTAGVVMIGGVRLSVSAVTSRTFTASKDTYVDIDNTGTPVYSESTNNAASQALTAGNMRIAIIITGATTIASPTLNNTINQGSTIAALPVASSVTYSVTDSLGNLIYPQYDQRLIGYRQITSTFTTGSTSVEDITGLTAVPFIVPGSILRTVRRTLYLPAAFTGGVAGQSINALIRTSGGTQVQAGLYNGGSALWNIPLTVSEYRITATGLSTYKASLQTTTTGGGVTASASAPAFLAVELA